MGKIEKALDTLLELEDVLPNFEARDPSVWINIALKYLKDAASAEEFYNEEVWADSYITDRKFGYLDYSSAYLHINQHLMIDTHSFCIRAVVGNDKKAVTRKIPENLKEKVIALDKIIHKAYNENKARYKSQNKV